MRFSFDMRCLSGTFSVIPCTYRRNILSLFKQALKEYAPEMYHEYWGEAKKNRSKPFTFSVRIPGAKSIKDKDTIYLTTDSPYIQISLSSHNTELLLVVYNALMKISTTYAAFSFKTRNTRFYLEKEPLFTANQALLKTISPIVVRKTNNKKGQGYLVPDDAGYIEALQSSLDNTCKQFLAGYREQSPDVTIAVDSYKVSKVPHYDKVIPAVNGIFRVAAPREVLKLMYDCGLGARRSQGFGMVEVI